MKFSRWIALAASSPRSWCVVAATTALGGAKAPAAQKASFTAALVSDIGKFTDKGFNQNQLKGLTTAKAKLGDHDDRAAVELDERLRAELQLGDPQGREARRSRPASCSRPTEATYAKKFPNVDFAITDYTVHTSPFADKKGNVLPAFRRTSRA